MYVPSTSDTRVEKLPLVFTDKARVEVINNLSSLNNNNNITSTFSDANDVSKIKLKTTSLLPSFFSRSDKDKNERLSNELSPSPTHQTSNASSLRSSVYSSLLPSYQQLTSPITRTMTNNSAASSSSGSIFSSISSLRSISTTHTSTSWESEKISLPSISNILKSNNNNNNNKNKNKNKNNNNANDSIDKNMINDNDNDNKNGVPQLSVVVDRSFRIKGEAHPREDVKFISLEKAISDIKDFNALMHNNIGYEVFIQLNEAIAEILKIDNLQLIDWNLNLIRCSLIVSELPPSWNNQIPEITVNGNRRYKIQDGFQSELVKLISSYRRQQKNYLPTSDINFRKFIKNVMQNRFLVFEKKLDQNNVVIKFNKNIKEEVIRIQLLPDVCNEEEFIEFLTNSDLFKEFNLETDFKRKVATVSVKQSKFLQSMKSVGGDELSYPYKILSLRNYFLNLLVASQTLFEFHYTINELLGKEKKDQNISDQEMKWLWDNIRERNFKKIEIFDKFY